jgi:hypothetical protein
MQRHADIFSEYEAQMASEAMSNPIKRNIGIDWKWVVPTALGAAIFVGGCVWGFHSEISRLDERLASLDKHISRVETAVRIVGAKQGGDTKTLIDEALTVAQKAADAGRVESAKATLEVANHLIVTLKKENHPADQDFFRGATDT